MASAGYRRLKSVKEADILALGGAGRDGITRGATKQLRPINIYTKFKEEKNQAISYHHSQLISKWKKITNSKYWLIDFNYELSISRNHKSPTCQPTHTPRV